MSRFASRSRISVSFIRIQHLRECGNGLGQLRLGNGQRRREADDVGVFAFRQKNIAAMQKRFDRVQRDLRRRFAIRQSQFQPGHQAKAARDLEF